MKDDTIDKEAFTILSCDDCGAELGYIEGHDPITKLCLDCFLSRPDTADEDEEDEG